MIDARKILEEVISKLHIIPSTDIPAIDLYMDQVTTFMNKHLASQKRYEEDKILTKTMINNYAKNNLLPPPEKKRYSKDHMIMLIFIYYFKNILTINDIKTILGPLSDQFFHSNSKQNLESIYSSLCQTESCQVGSVKSDIEHRIFRAEKAFTDYPEPEREYLQLFSLITSLIYDVYIKKLMIEELIDQFVKKPKKNVQRISGNNPIKSYTLMCI